MGRKKQEIVEGEYRVMPPVTTVEARENQAINLAYQVAEKQMREGTVSATVLTHFLKLATEKEKLEKEKLRSDLALANAKIAQIESQEELAEKYVAAMAALKEYNGEEVYYDEGDYEYEDGVGVY